MFPMSYDTVASLRHWHNYYEDVEPRVNLAMVTQSIMSAVENFVDIHVWNDDVNVELFDEDEDIGDDKNDTTNEPLENKASLLGG